MGRNLNLRAFWLTAIVVGLAVNSASGQHVHTAGEVDTYHHLTDCALAAVGKAPIGLCANRNHGKGNGAEACLTCGTKQPPVSTNSGLNTTLLQQQTIGGNFFIDNNSFNYQHFVLDYQVGQDTAGCVGAGGGFGGVGQGSAGCVGCGGGTPNSSLFEMFIERRHRFRDISQGGNFGPGVFTNYDVQLKIYDLSTPSATAWQIDVFDPREIWPKRLVDGLGGDMWDGIFVDQRNQAIKEIRLLTSDDILEKEVGKAAKIVLTNYEGIIHEFEPLSQYPSDGSVEPPSGQLPLDVFLQAQYKLDETSGTTASDSSGNGFNGTVTGALFVAGKNNNALEFDGTDDYVKLDSPSGPTINTAITIGAWVYADSSTGKRTIVAHGEATPSVVTYSGLIAHYEFENSAAPGEDSTTNNLDGTTNGDATVILDAQRGNVLSLDGTGDYIRVPFDSAFQLNEYTVSAWVNIAAEPGEFGIVGTREGNGKTFDVKVESTFIHGDVGNGTSWINTSLNIDSGSEGDLRVDSWRMITYVIDNTNKEMKLYIDGNLKKTISFTGTPLFMGSGNSLRIGHTGEVTEDMNGLIDDVQIYNRALTPTEVAGMIVPSASLVIADGKYQFNLTGGIVESDVFTGDVGSWVHLAGTYDGSTIRLYRNGLETDSVSFSEGLSLSDDWTLGASVATNDDFFDGKIDDVMIYNRAISADEMLEVATTALVAHYDFEEGTGTTAGDSSGNDFDGTINGGASWDSSTWVGSNALKFDGVDDYVDLGNPPELDFAGKITIAAWVRPDDISGAQQNIVSHGTAVYLRIKDGKYQVGNVEFTIPLADDGKWAHLVGMYDGIYWRLFRNGTLVDVKTSSTGSVKVNDDWAIGSRGDGTANFFKGSIDDVRIYNRVITDSQILGLARHSEAGKEKLFGGRLTRIEDRNGYGVDITYKTFTQTQIDESPGRQWQIDKITDPYGRQATFTYKSTQESGLWVVEKIDLPNGSDLDYSYTNGKLTQVDHPDGTTSKFSYGFEQVSQTTTVTYDDAAAAPTDRRKIVFLTNNFVLKLPNVEVTEVHNQSSLMVRIIVNGINEVAYLNLPSPIINTNLVYEGSGKLKEIDGIRSATHFKDGWSIDVPADGFDGITGTFESVFARLPGGSSLPTLQLGTHDDIDDRFGANYDYLYDSDTFITQKTYSDGTKEKWEYDPAKQGGNQFHLVTRYEDRLKRVTKYEYDSRGNMLKMQVGILVVSGSDVNQPEFAEYEWQYYPALNANEFLLRFEFDANDNRTEYIYNANHLLTQINEPDDTGAGFHTQSTYTYEDNGSTARRLKTSTDALGRTMTYTYDERDRQIKKEYFDGSTELTIYGTPGTADENLVVKWKDRNGNVTKNEYDAQGRANKTITAFSTMDQDGLNEVEVTDPNVRVETTLTYLEGTNLVFETISRGERTNNVFDYRQRPIESTVQPRSGKTLSNKIVFIDNLVFSMEDPYGRKSFNAYRSSDNELIRTIQATIPNPTAEPATFTDVVNKVRAGTPSTPAPNAEYLITDLELDAEKQQFATIDPRGVVDATEFDSRGRTVKSVEAATVLASYNRTNFEDEINESALAAISAKTETGYDDQSNVTEVRRPRFFDSGDTEGFNKANTTMTYNRRNLLKDRTEAAGDVGGEDATDSFTYNLDRTRDTRTDFRGNPWTTRWHLCCERSIAKIEPLADVDSDSATTDTRAARIKLYDAYGNETHIGTIADIDNFTAPTGKIGDPTYKTDLLDSETVNETTTRYDERHRVIAQTEWLVPRGSVDPDNVPIAGGGEAGDPDVEIAGVKQGLTTRKFYDEDLTDGVGLDNTTGLAVDKLDGSGSSNVSISQLLTELTSDGTSFGVNSDAFAMVIINPEEEIFVAIKDGTGREVATGSIEPYSGSSPNTPITWNTVQHDSVVTITGFGDVLQTDNYDALDHIKQNRTDSAGRAIESEDAENRITKLTYDGNNNQLSIRDPNNVGTDLVFDERNRRESRTDTQNDKTSQEYDKNNNEIKRVDAKNQGTEVDITTVKFDARDRRFERDDRINSITKWNYDDNNNLKTLEDGENQITSYDYDKRNLRFKTTWPDHVIGQNPGDSNYGITEQTYDAAQRGVRSTDQLGDTRTHNWDMADRHSSRDYRLRVNSPSGSIADTDSFQHDDADRMTQAVSGRYSNTCDMAYDDASRLTSESLTVLSQTYTCTYVYDDANRRTKITYPDSTVVDRAYTDRDQLNEVKYQSTVIDTRTYDVGKRLSTSTLNNGIVSTWGYRNDNLISTITRTGLTGADFTYDYDPNKNKLKETITTPMSNFGFGTTTPVGYDAEDRVTSWTRDDSNKTQSWALSLVGDWDTFTETGSTPKSETRTHGNTHELTAINSNTLQLDAKGNITQDNSKTNVHNYTWDFDNQLMFADVDGSPGDEIEYTYDALGRRVSKEIPSGMSTLTTVFVSRGPQVLAEYIGGTASTNPERKYAYGTYVDDRCLFVDATGASEVNYFYHANNLYSTTALTDTLAAVVERYGYDAYGNIVFLNASGTPLATQQSTVGQPHTFTGRRLDDETGIYYYRARYFDSGLGRFIGRDPTNYQDGENLYQYVQNNPVNHLDPTGKITLDIGRVRTEFQFPILNNSVPGITAFADARVFLFNNRSMTVFADAYLNVQTFAGGPAVPALIPRALQMRSTSGASLSWDCTLGGPGVSTVFIRTAGHGSWTVRSAQAMFFRGAPIILNRPANFLPVETVGPPLAQPAGPRLRLPVVEVGAWSDIFYPNTPLAVNAAFRVLSAVRITATILEPARIRVQVSSFAGGNAPLLTPGGIELPLGARPRSPVRRGFPTLLWEFTCP